MVFLLNWGILPFTLIHNCKRNSKKFKNYNGKGWPMTHLKDENPLSIIWKFQISSRNEDWWGSILGLLKSRRVAYFLSLNSMLILKARWGFLYAWSGFHVFLTSANNISSLLIMFSLIYIYELFFLVLYVCLFLVICWLGVLLVCWELFIFTLLIML